ncbi:MAG TPA: hypothetical protein VN851_02770, partial [Thermoanaerobaculia bacterium]|nr:hypothetical protein [Thermoanaerobaculia bacterium]
MLRELLPPRLRTWLRAGSGRVPLDWTASADRPHDDRGAPESVDVVIPVYQAPEAFARCLAALLAHTDLSRHRALLVLDGPQPTATEALLAAPIPGVEILRNPERR